jgi:hypothetical protein
MRSVAKQTILAAVLGWLATRVLRRVVGIALLVALIAGAAGIAGRHDLEDVRGVGRVTRCDLAALLSVARQLPDAVSRGSSSADRTRPALRRPARCHAFRAPARAPAR